MLMKTNKDSIEYTKPKTPIYKYKEVTLHTSHKPNQLLAAGYINVVNLCSYSALPASSSSTSHFHSPAVQNVN